MIAPPVHDAVNRAGVYIRKLRQINYGQSLGIRGADNFGLPVAEARVRGFFAPVVAAVQNFMRLIFSGCRPHKIRQSTIGRIAVEVRPHFVRGEAPKCLQYSPVKSGNAPSPARVDSEGKIFPLPVGANHSASFSVPHSSESRHFVAVFGVWHQFPIFINHAAKMAEMGASVKGESAVAKGDAPGNGQ